MNQNIKQLFVGLGIVAACVFGIAVLPDGNNEASQQQPVKAASQSSLPSETYIPPSYSEPVSTPAPSYTPPTSSGSGYTNSTGNYVPSPSDEYNSGASARCEDGTYSYSQSRRGTCSHHGGVAEWY